MKSKSFDHISCDVYEPLTVFAEHFRWTEDRYLAVTRKIFAQDLLNLELGFLVLSKWLTYRLFSNNVCGCAASHDGTTQMDETRDADFGTHLCQIMGCREIIFGWSIGYIRQVHNDCSPL
jgi:hypothetical protein